MKTLTRQLGLGAVLGISMGAMLGSGIFVLPGLAFLRTGSSVWLAYLLAGFCVLPAALSKAELATAMPVSGGTYVYIDRAFGPLASTIAGLGLWLSLLLKSAFALVGFGAYLTILTDASVTAIGMALLVAIVTLNIVGIRKVGKMQVWVVAVSVSSLLVLTIWGLGKQHGELLPSSFPGGAAGFFGTVGFVYISFAGVTKVAAVAEEVRNPSRNLPLGILLSLGIVTLLYSLVTYVMVEVIPGSDFQGDLRPVYTMAWHVGGPTVGVLAALLGILTMTSMANAGLMAASRFPFAMSRENLLPTTLAYVHERFMTPVVSILLTGSLMAAAILFLDVAGIAKLASSLMILAFTAVNLAVIVLRESGVDWYRPAFRTPFYPVMQVAGVLIGIALLALLGISGLVAAAVAFVPGLLLFLSFGRRNTVRRGVLGRLGPRRELIAELALPKGVGSPGEAAVVLPLVGSGVPTEALVDVAGALAQQGKVEVVHLTEVPEQLMLDASLVDDAHVDALARRTARIASEHDLAVEFDSLVTRDLTRTIHAISRRVHCSWVVMEWRGRLKRGFLPFRPLGWLVEHLACNLAIFKNSGLQSPRDILVFAEPGPHDSLVASTADNLARIHGAKLTFVGYVDRSASPMVRQAEMDYLEQISRLCSSAPSLRLVEGKNKLRELTALSATFDLLILGGGPQLRLRDLLRGSFPDLLTDAAACSVLRLRTPREQTHVSVASHEQGEGNASVLVEHLAKGCVQARLEPMTKEMLFSHFARAFSEALPGLERRKVEQALWERERMQNTAVEKGMALPHATMAEADQAWLGIFTTRDPIDYKAPDGCPVDIFFVTLGPPSSRSTHLQILASIARLVLQTDLLDRLRAGADPEDLHRSLLEATSQTDSHAATPDS